MNCKVWICLLLVLSIAVFSGCSSLTDDTQIQQNGTESASGSETAVLAVENMFTDRDKEIGYEESTATVITLADNASSCSGENVVINGSTVTITDEGEYLLSGTLTNGTVMIDGDNTDKVHLVLNGVSITAENTAALYIKQADKVFLTTANGTENTLSVTGEYVNTGEDNIDAVIFSKDDLTLNGAGSLIINAAAGHGIVSKDDLVLTSGTYEIKAASHALSGKDSVRIAEGNYTLASGKDGIHAENAQDASLGFLYIEGGSFSIAAEGDGIDAGAYAQIVGGDFSITAGGGSANAPAKIEEFGFGGFGGSGHSTASSTDSASVKGVKASGDLTVSGGVFTIDSADDAIHSNSSVTISGGTFQIASGDDGLHADADTVISDGRIEITQSYEGIEGQTVTISGGDITLTASDDGINAAGGNDESGFGGGWMPDAFASDSSSWIEISGGVLHINAEGDGIDSNGDLTVSGGEIYISGPENSGNGSLDYGGSAVITGGVFVAAGAAGMAENFGSDSTQGAILVNLSSFADGEVSLKDENGAILVSYTPEKAYNNILISCPGIETGKTYTVSAAGSEVSVEMTSLIYTDGSPFGLGAGGMKGGEEMGGGDGPGSIR